jgi:hypothetical protein
MRILASLVFVVLIAAPIPLRAQGCTQCLDNTAATPPATRRAYRHAILLLTFTATGLFAGGVALLHRNR